MKRDKRKFDFARLQGKVGRDLQGRLSKGRHEEPCEKRLKKELLATLNDPPREGGETRPVES